MRRALGPALHGRVSTVRASAICLCVIAIGCGGDAAVEQAPAPPPPPPVDCPARLLGIASRVRSAEVAPFVSLPDGVELATVPGEASTGDAPPVVAIAANGTDVWIAGTPARRPGHALDFLDTLDRNFGLLHPGATPTDRVRIAADRRATMAAVADLLPGTIGPRRRPVLVARGETAPSLPACPSSGGAACSTPIDSRGELAAFAPAFRATCPPAARMLVAVDGAAHEYRPEIIATGVRELIPDPTCPCATLDLDLLEHAVLRGAGAGRRPLIEISLTLPLGDADRAQTVQAWATAHAH